MAAWVKTKTIGYGSLDGDISLAVRHGFAPLVVKSTHIREEWELIQREGEILRLFQDCPEIITCYGEDISMEKGKKTYNLLLEYAPGGNLEELIIRAGGKLPEKEASKYAYTILRGLACMHERDYVHCDIKPKNILVFHSDDDEGGYEVRIADFDTAKLKDDDDMVYEIEEKMNRYKGSRWYTSPESVALGMNEAPKDIWALGCTVSEMVTGRSPWLKFYRREMLYEIGFGTKLPEIPEDMSEEGKDFLRLCLERDHKKRPTAKMLLNHSFVLMNGKDHSETSGLSGGGVETQPWISTKGMFEPEATAAAAAEAGASSSCSFKRRSYAQALLSKPALPIYDKRSIKQLL